MAWIARVVVPDLPHHVTQRGNQRETVFFEADAEPGISQLVSVDLSCAARMRQTA